jgi:hypothetical protein
MTTMTVRIPARQYEDEEDCLSTAASDYAREYGLVGWDLAPEWEDEQRETILLTVPGPGIVAGEAEDTRTGVSRGQDVPVVVTLPGGAEVEGTVTLLPAVDGRPEYESWGDEPGQWVEGHLLHALTRAYPGPAALRAVLGELEAIAAEQCGRH